MNIRDIIVGGTFACLWLPSCNSVSPEKLKGEWVVVQLGEQVVNRPEAAPYLGFEQDRVYGYTGCNRLNAQVSEADLKKGHVDFSRTATTMMSCPDAPYESAFLAEMSKVKELRLKGRQLQLLDDQGNLRIALEERKLTAELLNGEWTAIEIQGKPVMPNEEEEEPFLGFNTKDSLYYGFTGCNRLTGKMQLEQLLKGNADFASAAMTRMLCADDKYESAFMSALSQARKLVYRDSHILLQDERGDTLIKFRRASTTSTD